MIKIAAKQISSTPFEGACKFESDMTNDGRRTAKIRYGNNEYECERANELAAVDDDEEEEEEEEEETSLRTEREEEEARQIQ